MAKEVAEPQTASLRTVPADIWPDAQRLNEATGEPSFYAKLLADVVPLIDPTSGISEPQATLGFADEAGKTDTQDALGAAKKFRSSMNSAANKAGHGMEARIRNTDEGFCVYWRITPKRARVASPPEGK